jgi:hypothetical protein
LRKSNSLEFIINSRQKERALGSYQKALKLYPCFSTVNRVIDELDKPMAYGWQRWQMHARSTTARQPCTHRHR